MTFVLRLGRIVRTVLLDMDGGDGRILKEMAKKGAIRENRGNNRNNINGLTNSIFTFPHFYLRQTQTLGNDEDSDALESLTALFI